MAVRDEATAECKRLYKDIREEERFKIGDLSFYLKKLEKEQIKFKVIRR